MGLIWHAESQTILVGKERLTLLGWPLFPCLAGAARLDTEISVKAPKHNSLNRFAGNAYHVSGYGMWLMVCLACLRLEN